MTIISIHQPEHLPWPGFFDKMAQSEIFVILDDVQFRKNYFQNRNKIKTHTGEMFVTVPVSVSSSNLIMDIKVNNNLFWSDKHWKSIEMNYRKAPFFNRYSDGLKKIYEKRWDKLVDLNIALITFIKDELGITTRIVRSSELGVTGIKTDHLINICKKLDATAYLAGRWAMKLDYFEPEKFEREKIQLVFHEYSPPVYPQLFGEYLPYMSTIDLLFNCGEKSMEYIVRGRKLEDGGDAK